MLVHSYIPDFLLGVSMMPLLKSSLKNRKKIESYRAIVGTNALMKLLEGTILLIWGRRLPTDSLQFGYTPGTGMTQCTWMIVEVINHFKKHGTNLWIITMDCSQAFDVCKWGILFDIMKGFHASPDSPPDHRQLQGAVCLSGLGGKLQQGDEDQEWDRSR